MRERTVALAGVFQAARVTRDLAREGHGDEADLAVLVRSLLVIDAMDTLAVYGGVRGLRTGLALVQRRQSAQADIANFEIARYVLSLSQLAARLGSEPQVAEKIGMRLKGVESVDAPIEIPGDAAADINSYDSSENRRFAALADIYSDTISQLTPQIVVHGERGHLGEPQTVDKVRTALFAGVRAAWLWQQVGGRKWHLVLQKGAYARTAEELLESGFDERTPDNEMVDDSRIESPTKSPAASSQPSDESVDDGAADDVDSRDDDAKDRASNVTNINRRR